MVDMPDVSCYDEFVSELFIYALLAGGVFECLATWQCARQSPRPTLLIADRYGALYARYAADEESELPPGVGLEDLEYITIQCPE
jgi:hypothetical protein